MKWEDIMTGLIEERLRRDTIESESLMWGEANSEETIKGMVDIFERFEFKDEFEIGDIVYLKTDPDQHERMIVGKDVRPQHTLYVLVYGTETSYHYDIEISKEKDVLKTLK